MRALVYGLAGGGLVVATMAAIYSQSKEAFLSPVFQWSLVILYLIAMVLVLLRRPQLEKMEAVRTSLVTFMIISACYYLYTFLLYEFFDPSLYELQSELMIENAEYYATGTPGYLNETPQVKYAPEKLKYTLGSIAYNYALGILSGAAVSFLLGNLFGRKSEA